MQLDSSIANNSSADVLCRRRQDLSMTPRIRSTRAEGGLPPPEIWPAGDDDTSLPAPAYGRGRGSKTLTTYLVAALRLRGLVDRQSTLALNEP